MTVATTVRLPDEIGEALSDYCKSRGCVKNRVIALAVRDYLAGDAPAAPVMFTEHEPDDRQREGR